jgi:hypothetical protein
MARRKVSGQSARQLRLLSDERRSGWRRGPFPKPPVVGDPYSNLDYDQYDNATVADEGSPAPEIRLMRVQIHQTAALICEKGRAQEEIVELQKHLNRQVSVLLRAIESVRRDDGGTSRGRIEDAAIEEFWESEEKGGAA